MSRELAYTPYFSETLKEYEELGSEVAEVLAGRVATHDDARDGFSLLPYDIERHPFLRPDCIHVAGKNAEPESLHNLASVVYKGTEKVIDNYKKRPDLLNHAYDRLADGDSIASLTDHRNVIGVAIAGGAFACALYEVHGIKPSDIRAGIYTSAMIKRTQMMGTTATIELLSGVFSDTFFSLPPSKSLRESAIPRDYRLDFNSASIQHFEEELDGNKPFILMLAGSGMRDLAVTRRFRRQQIFMGPLADGTIDILRKMYTLPNGLDITNETPDHYIDGLHRPISVPQQAHDYMAKIAIGMSKASGTKRRYFQSREELEKELEHTKEYGNKPNQSVEDY